jgi:hypothetical protein
MNIPEVTQNDWRELYAAALEFRNRKPWEWMSSADLFAVKHPDTGEYAYCCIMGELGEMFSLAAYLGDEGLQGYLALSENQDELMPETVYNQKCLMTSFENRDALEKKDLDDIKKLGFAIRGKAQWPLFRIFEPGLAPWYLNTEQVRFMTLLLRQAIFIAESALQTPDIIIPSIEKCTARIPVKKNGNVEWQTSVIDLAVEMKETGVPQYDNEIKLRNLKKNCKPAAGASWGVDWFYLPTPIHEGNRPYYPVAVVIIDSENSFIMNFELTTKDEVHTTIHNKLIETIEQQKSYPRLLFIDKPDVAASLAAIAGSLGISFDDTEGHDLFCELKENIFDRFIKM